MYSALFQTNETCIVIVESGKSIQSQDTDKTL